MINGSEKVDYSVEAEGVIQMIDQSSLYMYDILPLTFKCLRCSPPERLVEGYNRYIFRMGGHI